MLAVALNYIGIPEADNCFVPMFMRQFNDFKVIKLSPYDEKSKSRLQLCEPEEYEEIVKQIEKEWDPSGTCLELRGPKAKLQKMVRQKLFFDEEKIAKVLLDSSNGISDFPWAVQIAMIQPPVPEGRQDKGRLKKADVMVINHSGDEECRDYIKKVQAIRADLPVIVKDLREGWPQELTDSLEAAFAGYLEKRQRIKELLAGKYPEQMLSCKQAHRLAGKLKVDSFLLGNVCDECGYIINNCGLGCF
ncbi:MAG: hypothetical protein ABFD18_15145 [Syntrophomonas sp.]